MDLVDCSSGGNVPNADLPVKKDYQTSFAAEIRRQTGIATGAVGLITEAQHSEKIVSEGDADAVLLARELLHAPYWPLHAAHALAEDPEWPPQYQRAKPRG